MNKHNNAINPQPRAERTAKQRVVSALAFLRTRLGIALVTSFAQIFVWDMMWSAATTFRSLSFVAAYLTLILWMLVMSLPTIFSQRRAWVQLLVWLLVDGLLIANLMYFRTYYSAIPAASYLLVGNLRDFGASVVDSLRVTDAILPVMSLVGYMLMRRAESHPVRKGKWLIAIGIDILLIILSSLPYGGIQKHVNHLTQQCYYTNCPPVVYGIPGKILADIMTQTAPVTQEDIDLVNRFIAEHNALVADSLDASGRTPRKVVMIFLESIESWAVSDSVEGHAVMPNLSRLAADTTSFYAPRVLTQTGNGRSIDAQLLVMTGLLPMRNEVYAMSHIDNEYPSIIKAIRQREPALRASLLTGDKATVWNQARVAHAFGIDTIIDAPNWRLTDRIGNPPKLSDEALFTQTIERCKRGDILRNDSKPEFVQIVAYSSHNPFVIPEDKRQLHLKGKYPSKYADYVTAANYVDHWLGTFVDYLRTRPDWHDITVIIVGDHEGLAAYRSEMPGKVDRGQHTPLVVLNAPKPGRYDKEMGQVDIFPTLVDQFGLGKYTWHGLGMSVLDRRHPGVAVAPDGSVKGGKSAPGWMTRAYGVSDRIIRFNLNEN